LLRCFCLKFAVCIFFLLFKICIFVVVVKDGHTYWFSADAFRYFRPRAVDSLLLPPPPADTLVAATAAAAPRGLDARWAAVAAGGLFVDHVCFVTTGRGPLHGLASATVGLLAHRLARDLDVAREELETGAPAAGQEAPLAARVLGIWQRLSADADTSATTAQVLRLFATCSEPDFAYLTTNPADWANQIVVVI
jgi:hypothetical protein